MLKELSKFLNLFKYEIINKSKLNTLKNEKGFNYFQCLIMLLKILLVLGFLGIFYIQCRVFIMNLEVSELLIKYFIIFASIFMFINVVYFFRYEIFNGKDISRLLSFPLTLKNIILYKAFKIILFSFTIYTALSLCFILAFSQSIKLSLTTISFYIITALTFPILLTNFAGVLVMVFRFAKYITKNKSLLYGMLVISIVEYVCLIFLCKFIVLQIIGALAIYILNTITLYLLSKIIAHDYIAIYEACKIYKEKKYSMKIKKQSIFKALLFKEFKMYSSNSFYMINSSFGAIICMIFSIVYSCIINFSTTLPKEIIFILNISLPVILSIIIGNCCTTYCTMSLEGKELWILKKAPIKVELIYLSKILLNLIITVPTIIISASIINISLNDSIILSVKIYNYILPIIASCFYSIFGCFINNIIYNLKWDNENILIKRTITLPLTIIMVIFSSSLIEIVVIFLNKTIPISYLYFIFSLIFILVSFTLFIILKKLGYKQICYME